MMDVVHQQIKEGEVLFLGLPRELIMAVNMFGIMWTVVVGLEPGGQYLGIQTDLSRDVESQFNDTGLNLGTEAYAVCASYAHQQVRQAAGEVVVLHKGFLLAFDQRREEEHCLLDDPFVVGAGGDFGHRDINLLCSSKGNTWMWEGTSGLVTEETCQFLKSDLDLFGGFIIVGEVGGVTPCVLIIGYDQKRCPDLFIADLGESHQ